MKQRTLETLFRELGLVDDLTGLVPEIDITITMETITHRTGQSLVVVEDATTREMRIEKRMDISTMLINIHTAQYEV